MAAEPPFHEIDLDVRGLPAPEPLQRVVALLPRLREGRTFIRMIHRQEPCLLFPILEKQALAYRMIQRSDGSFSIWIYPQQERQLGTWIEKQAALEESPA